jgi:FAD/FMN-containing dehydrogenase
MDDFLRQLESITGPRGLLTEPADMQPALTEWRGLFHGQALAVVLPESTADAAAVIRACAARGVGVVPQGGNTGLVGGAIPHSTAAAPQVIVGTRRLRRVRELDAANYTLTAEAGCLLADLQAAAADADRLFPLSLAAEGSCHLGGNISTNAGGINVLRYGNTRDLVLGLEVVLADGRVLDVLRSLRKDNTGYDLKQLFIGAEGTLGFVTAATCKLFPRPRSEATAFVAVAGPGEAVRLHAAARDRLADGLVAFELINRLALELAVQHIPDIRRPLDSGPEWFVLLELARGADGASAEMEAFLGACLDEGLVMDGALATSDSQRRQFWRLRHSISEAQKLAGAGIKHDISVPIARVPDFVRLASDAVSAVAPGARLVIFGHLGDGNLHFNVQQPPAAEREVFLAQWEPVSAAVHSIAADLGGSFSAEHGVGVLKRAELARYRGGVELEVMRAVKAALDPGGIMNPGKLLPPQ